MTTIPNFFCYLDVSYDPDLKLSILTYSSFLKNLLIIPVKLNTQMRLGESMMIVQIDFIFSFLSFLRPQISKVCILFVSE